MSPAHILAAQATRLAYIGAIAAIGLATACPYVALLLMILPGEFYINPRS